MVGSRNFNLKFSLIVLFIIYAAFVVRAYIAIDPDFPWRVRSGNLYLESGIPKTDPFSYSFPWVDHAWLQSILFAVLLGVIGKLGLSIIYATLAFAAALIPYRIFAKNQSGKTESSWQMSFLLILALTLLFPFSGVRVQVMSWFLFSVLVALVFQDKLWSKFSRFLPFYFLAWANLHGGVASGLMFLAAVFAVRTASKRELNLKDLAILIASITATLINPYGVGLWREIFSSISDPSLRWSITEWMPGIAMMDLSLAALLAFSIFFTVKYWKKISYELTAASILFLAMGVLSRRHLPLWVLIAVPLIGKALGIFYDEIKIIKGAKEKLGIVAKIAFFSSIGIFIFQGILAMADARYISENTFYPKDAVSYLKANPRTGEIFSDYGWGGYLILNLPEKKVFIDGRMPSWKWDTNEKSESTSAFEDYKGILSGFFYFRQQFAKHEINTVLLPIARGDNIYGLLGDKFVTLFRNGKEIYRYDLVKQLEKEGWIKEYEDQVAVIYSRP